MRSIETPEDFTEIKREAIKQVNFYIDKANDKLSIHLPYPKVVFSIKGTTAGRAWIGRNIIEFNPTLLASNIEEFLNRTPGHEVAHLAAHMKFGHGIKPHGHEWKKCMWCLNLPAVTCHNYDMQAVTGVKVARQIVKPNIVDGAKVTSIKCGHLIEFD